MKDYFNLKKSKLLLLTLLAFFVGASPAWADEVTDDFSSYTAPANGAKELGENWVIVGNDGNYSSFGSNYDYIYYNAFNEAYVAGNYASNYSMSNYLVLKKQVTGTVTFTVTNGDSNSALSVYVSKANASGDTYAPTGTAQSYSVPSRTSTPKEYTFDAGSEPTYVAFCLNGGSKKLKLWSVTYTEAGEVAPVEGPQLYVKDNGDAITSPFTFDFGQAAAGTTHIFTLNNPGTQDLSISVSETGSFGATLSAETIAAGGEATLTLTMPTATGSSEITITPADGSGIEPFVINASATVAANFAINPSSAQSLGATTVGGTLEKVFTITNSGNANLLVTFTAPEGFSIPNYVKFTDSENWGTANLYYWGEGVSSVSWPGVAMTQIENNEYGQKQFRAVVPDGVTGIIFNNGSAQTVDITYSAGTEGYYPTGLVDGKYEVGSWNAGPGWNVAAGGSRDFTIVMNAASTGAKSGSIALAFDALNATEFTIPVSGYVIDDSKYFVDFSGNELPEGWTNSTNSGAAWTFADGVAYGQYASYKNAKMTSPLLTVADGESLVFQTKGNTSYADMKVNVFDRSWNKIKTVDFSTEARNAYTAGEYTVVTLSGLDAGDYRLEFEAYNSYIDNVNGFTVNQNDPQMGIYTDAECTVAAATSVTKEFGFVTEAPDAVTYYIKNDGTGTMTLTKTDVDGITATLDKTSVGAGEKATLTIAMPVADNGGYHGGNVVVTAEGLGTFTVAVSGVVVEDGKFNLDFASQDIPATWTAGNWSKSSSGYAEVGYSSSTMQTSTLVAKANETLVVEAKQSYSTSSYTFGVKYREVGTETWNDLISAANIGTSWVILAGTITEAGNYEFQFTGNNTQIRRIYGLSKPEAPEMVVYDGEAVAGASYNFGKVTDEADATHTFTVKNEGLATLTGLKAELSGDNADHYTVAIAGATGDNSDEIAAGATATITVTQLKDNLGSHSASLTISATDLDDKVIALSGNTVDHTVLNVDFDTSSEWPAEILQHGDNWTVYNYNGSGETRNGSYSTASSLILTPLTVADATNKLTFDVAYYNYSSYRELTVSYTTDGGVTWKDYNWGTEETPVTDLKDNIGYSYANKEITGIPVGTTAFKFTGKSIKLDNIAGDMKVTTAPLVAFDATEDNISGKNLTADATATYTLNNYGNADYVATVAANNVNVAATGDDVTFEGNTLTVPAGKTATITATMAFAAPYGEKTGSLAITSESWVGDISASYTATLIDPTDFVIDFADNQKPAGWYSESWTYNTGAARVYTGTVKPMITELVGAETGKNTLKFDAQVASGSDEQTLNVYTSADRKTWSEAQAFTLTADVQNFSLTALEAGNYYVKFEASNAIVDNIKGVKKLDAPAHDLYEVSTTMAETGVPSASYTAKVTAISLRADETVNVELWLKKGDAYSKVVASLENEALSANTSREFTLTGDLPAEAGDYTAWVTVKNSDNSAFFNTDEKTITLAHVPALTINSFTRISDANVVADENNEFTAEFTVNVTNSGTTDLNADQVSVTLTDGTNAYENATATWTAANSQTVFLNPGNYTTEAKMVLYEWNTDEDGQWVEFTQISDNFYSAELNGKKNFIIARAKSDATEFGFDNGSLYNKSADQNIANGNIYGNDGYNGDVLKLTTGTMGTLAKNVSTTLKVSVTLTAENTSYSFYAKENVKNTSYMMSQSVSVTPYVTVALDETETYDATTSTYGKVTLNRPFIAGWNTLVLPFDVDAETFADKFGEDAVLYELNANNDGELQFKKTTSDGLVAGTPYLLSLSAVVGELTFTDVTVQPGTSLYMHNVNKSGAEFKGNYVNGFDMEGKYGVTPAGQVKKGAAGSTMKAYRAYITMPAGQTARIAIFDETTGISRVLSAKELEGTDIFNMKGQRVSESAKGVVIINGKKVVIK